MAKKLLSWHQKGQAPCALLVGGSNFNLLDSMDLDAYYMDNISLKNESYRSKNPPVHS
jgi:hypothetical protein